MRAEPQIPIPESLRRSQAAFALGIRQPFSFDTGKFACRMETYPSQAAASVLPRGGQGSRERLAVYNQQYWYRLLTAIQDQFPLLGASLGLWELNRLASAYLDRHPSRSPFLDRIGGGLPDFLRATVPERVRDRQIAGLDAAYQRAFHAPGQVALDPQRLTGPEAAGLEASPLHVQPWLSLFQEDWNLMEARERLAAEPMEKPAFRAQSGFWAIYRKEARVETLGLAEAPFRLLLALAEGVPLGEACARLASACDEAAANRIAQALPGWFSQWTALGWFTHPGHSADPEET
jgi:hypothetical protein